MTRMTLEEALELKHLREQVKELQARGTQLEIDLRLNKRLYQAARQVLEYVLLDSSFTAALHRAGDENSKITDQGVANTILAGSRLLFDRIAILEKDGATPSRQYAREFVKQAADLPFNVDAYSQFVWTFVNKFREVVGD